MHSSSSPCFYLVNLFFTFLLSLFFFPSPLLQCRASPCLTWTFKMVFYWVVTPLDLLPLVPCTLRQHQTDCSVVKIFHCLWDEIFNRPIIAFSFPISYFNMGQKVLNEGIFVYCFLRLLASFPFYPCPIFQLCSTTSHFWDLPCLLSFSAFISTLLSDKKLLLLFAIYIVDAQSFETFLIYLIFCVSFLTHLLLP